MTRTRTRTSARGKLIVLEGPDGTGKSTQAAMLCDRLTREGYAVHRTAEPTNSSIGTTARQMARQGASSDVLALLFAADRYHHVATEIEPALAAGKHVICERYIPSSIVYESYAVQDAPTVARYGWNVEQINGEMLGEVLPTPDITVVLEAPLSVLVQRIVGRKDGPDAMQTEDVLGRVRNGYDVFVRHARIMLWNVAVVDADTTPVSLGTDVYVAVRRVIGGPQKEDACEG
jgi:dTMP kinase